MQSQHSKSIAFPYTENKLSGKETKKKNLCIIPSKIIKFLAVNLTKGVKKLYTEKYKTSMKGIKGTNK